MDMNKLTQKSQEAVQAAQAKAVTFGHQEIDGEHLLLVLLEDAGGLIPRVLSKAEVVVDGLTHGLAEALRRRPRVSG
ncbi:MAG: Clp protease N-terminal domain-containing protein, partial [Acidobacteriota bacterium]